jgi:hypothetical protein
VKRHTVSPVANPHRPASDLARAEIMPLEASERIALFPWHVLNFDFLKLSNSLGHFRVSPFTVDLPTV